MIGRPSDINKTKMATKRWIKSTKISMEKRVTRVQTDATKLSALRVQTRYTRSGWSWTALTPTSPTMPRACASIAIIAKVEPKKLGIARTKLSPTTPRASASIAILPTTTREKKWSEAANRQRITLKRSLLSTAWMPRAQKTGRRRSCKALLLQLNLRQTARKNPKK